MEEELIKKEETNKNAKKNILDPFSTIVKLAILSHKSAGTKINISNNIIQLQEVGIFQSFVRLIQKNNKIDLQHLYNPIHFASEHFLSDDMTNDIPNIRTLFESALQGIHKLTETYKEHSLIVICLHYYTSIIMNFLGDYYDDELFKSDEMTSQYTDDILHAFSSRWTNDKLQLVLELNDFLLKNQTSTDSINCLELFMKGIDEETQKIVNETSK